MLLTFIGSVSAMTVCTTSLMGSGVHFPRL
jgi:hypothetical protein